MAKGKKSSKDQATGKKSGIADTVMATASTVIKEVEKVGDFFLTEVRDGLSTVTDKIATTAKGVTEIQARQGLKSLVKEVEEIGDSVVEAVSQKLDQLRGKVEQETAELRNTSDKKGK